MRTARMTLLSLIALALLIGPGAIRNAEAGIRVRATVRTPVVRIQVGSRPAYHSCNYRCDHQPNRYRTADLITRRDRRIAKRLAWYTGLPTREVLRLKRMGYGWREIGRWLDVPPRVVSASLESRSWKRYRDNDHHRHGYGQPRTRRSDYRLTYHERDYLR